MDAHSAITISSADRHDGQQWDDFVIAHPDSTCFHLHGWKRVIEEALGYETHYLIARRDGQIAGVLPIASVASRLFSRSVTSLPFCSYGGPISSDPAVTAALHREALRITERFGANHLEYRSLKEIDPAWPTQPLYSTFRAPLSPAITDHKTIPYKRRSIVRKAIKLGLTAQRDRDPDTFFELYAENSHAHGSPALPRRYFRILLDALGDAVDILQVRDAAGRPISAVMSFFLRNEIHAGFAGETRSARDLAANDFKYWSLMCDAAARGCTTFDFGRSKADTGSFEFKRWWGFDPTPLYYQFPYLKSGVVPQNNPSNPRYALAIRTWTRLPRFVVDRLGPAIIHGLG